MASATGWRGDRNGELTVALFTRTRVPVARGAERKWKIRCSLVEHSMSYSNPTEMHDRMSDLAAVADWPRRGK